ncbi:helix-turn-helix transcriptional regulator [Namhaeicola litoreus]|uniref:Helix-turn-helix transcriptional regulator n=1 Tax=Namhaeicola litoreus TaxID=1052145 RepID=A0ABW3Y1U4_9FLAO
MAESIDESMAFKFEVEPGFSIIKLKNNRPIDKNFFHKGDSNVIQMHFGIQGSYQLNFNNGNYHLEIGENNSYLIYNPQVNLPVDLLLHARTRAIVLLISIDKFHSFFTKEANLIHFLNPENIEKKYYLEKALEPSLMIVLNQIYNYGLHSSLEKLYTRGKVYELLSLYFHQSDADDKQKCPYLEDDNNVEKIRLAKEILIDNFAEPPTLTDLANQVNLPLQYLKDGFKHIYGETAFAFLFNYKMEYARNLLTTKKYNIAEISFEVGYSTPSHFIAAFKKKYGSTPKKYLQSIGV